MNCWISFVLLLWAVFCEGFEVGYTASMVNWPFVAGIYYKYGYYHNRRPFCSGTVITDTYVLTTVGCMNRPNPEIPQRPLYTDVTSISAWVGSSFSFVSTTQNVEAQMVFMRRYYFPEQEDLEKTYGKDAPPSNSYAVNNFTYYYIDFCVLETYDKIIYNNYVHAVPFDVQNTASAMSIWNNTVIQFGEYRVPIPDCFTAGWGSYPYGNEVWRLYRLRYVKARFTEKVHCTIAYCGNCSLCYLRHFNESTYACFSIYMTGDTCLEDEGAPLFCPWFGYRNDQGEGWGALLGHMSGKMGNCQKTELPSMFNLIWLAYPFLSRVTRIAWPPPGLEWIIPQRDEDLDYEQELL